MSVSVRRATADDAGVTPGSARYFFGAGFFFAGLAFFAGFAFFAPPAGLLALADFG